VEGVWARISCVLNMDSSVNFGFGAKYPTASKPKDVQCGGGGRDGGDFSLKNVDAICWLR